MIEIASNIAKADIVQMPADLFTGRIIVIHSASDVEKAVRYLKGFPVLGIDTETRPSFAKGKTYEVALMQVSTEDTCFLFRLNMIGMCPPVVRLLSHPTLVKVGLSLKDDIRMLHFVGEFASNNFIDLQNIVGQVGIRDMSLQKIYANLFGRKISKSQRLSNWEADSLTEGQMRYAATDAWACVQIYNCLAEMERTGDYEVIKS